MTFAEELETLLIKYNLDQVYGTPTLALSDYIQACLQAYSTVVQNYDPTLGTKISVTLDFSTGNWIPVL